MLHRGRLAEVVPFRRLRMEAVCPPLPGRSGREIEVGITYDLESVGEGVRVRECFDIRNHGLPWLVALLVQWIHRRGTRKDPSALEQLRDLLGRSGNVRP